MDGTRTIHCPAPIRPSGTSRYTRSPSLAPGRDDGRALHDGPLVLVGGNHGEAVGFAAFPCGAVAVFVELPAALAARAAIAGGDAPRLAVSRECHLEPYPGWRRRRELRPVEERRFNLRWRELGG